MPKKRILILSISVAVILLAVILTLAALNIESNNTPQDEPQDTSDEPLDIFLDMTTSASTAATTAATTASTTAATTAPPSLLFEAKRDGTCTVIGIGSIRGSSLVIPETSPDGDTVTAIADGAFEGCDFLELISIPSTIKEIGNGAFVDCPALISFSVSSANTKYCAVDGVLFSKDKTAIICYPANKADTSYLLSSNVNSVAPYAFDGTRNLSSILYRGSAADFQNIVIGTGNSTFTSLSLTCNYTPPSDESN